MTAGPGNQVNQTCRLRRAGLALSLVAALFAVRVQAEPTPLWKLELDRPGGRFRASLPVFLAWTDREIFGVAPDSGNVLWRIGPLKDPHVGAGLDQIDHASNLELLAGGSAALLSVGIQDSLGIPPLSLIDLRDGHTLWTCREEGVQRSIGSFLIPGTSQLLVRASMSPDGSKKTAFLVDLASGVTTWTSKSLGEEFQSVLPFWWGSCRVRSHQVPFIDSDSSMILHMRDGVFQRFDLNTGALNWTAQGKHAEPFTSTTDMKHRARLSGAETARRTTYNSKTQKVEYDLTKEFEEFKEREIDFYLAQMLRSSTGDRFYAPYQRSVAAFSLASGELLWKSPPRLDGAVAQMEETPAGLLVQTVDPSGIDFHHRVLLLDAVTGAVKWSWPKRKPFLNPGYWTDASNFLREEHRVVIAAEGNLRATDLSELKEQTLGRLKFDGFDQARTLLNTPDGYAVIGRSNLGIYTKADGQRTKKYYREPPSDAGWGLGLLVLSAVTKGWIDPKLGWEWPTDDLSSSDERESYVYFLARMKVGGNEGTGIVRVRRETGDYAGEIFLGAKTPRYSLDADGRLYFWSASKTIQCYRF